jgi:multidrug transporter EmrE-like cation transporter
MQQLAMVIGAAIAFAVGGIFMMWSEGMTRPWPSAAFVALYVLGASLQALAMTKSELGVVYVIVLGAEAFFAVAFGCWFFRETLSPAKAIAIALILGGIVLLKFGDATAQPVAEPAETPGRP